MLVSSGKKSFSSKKSNIYAKMSIKMRLELDSRRLLGTVNKANYSSLRSAGAYVRKAARNAVFISKHASKEGTPPHTRRGLLKRSILFGVDKSRMSVVIGPAKKFIGVSMTAHEFGGMYRRRRYPKRPLMGPTLNRTAPELPKLWANAVKR